MKEAGEAVAVAVVLESAIEEVFAGVPKAVNAALPMPIRTAATRNTLRIPENLSDVRTTASRQ